MLDAFLDHKDAEIVAFCDLYQPYLDFAAKKIGGSPKTTKNYHDVLAMKDVDAVVICTPDHWHALQTIHACQAGKDVYVEKPLSLCVEEGRHMVEAARKHKRVTQVGLMRRSSAFCREACEFVRKGGIGQVTVARAFHIQNEWPKGIGNPPNEEPPKDFSWDAWLGPAPKVPYNKNRTFYRFRWFYDYSGGQLTNFGVHYLDMIHWALGQDAPLAVTAIGGKYADHGQPRSPRHAGGALAVPRQHAGDVLAVQRNAAPAGIKGGEIEFRGTKGTRLHPGQRLGGRAGRADRQRVPGPHAGGPRVGTRLPRGGQAGDRSPQGHGRQGRHGGPRPQFPGLLVSRDPCNCDIEIGHRDTTAALIGNIALRTKSYLEWDAKAEKFVNNPTADARLRYEYRAPYRLPT